MEIIPNENIVYFMKKNDEEPEFLPLASPDLRDEDISRVVEVLKSGMLVQGDKVAELESQFSAWTGAKHAVAVSNGTASLHIALLAHGIGPGDEVIIPALSYIATANVVEVTGAKPVFVDIEERSFNIDCAKIEDAVTDKTKAIIPVHEFGLICNMGDVIKIAEKYSLTVIEDAACALGSIKEGIHAGNFGSCGSFSLHPRKAITSGEGGMLVTDDDDLAIKFKMYRNHGVDPTVIDRCEFAMAGLNYRLTDIQAALAIGQLERLNDGLRVKRRYAERYDKEIINPKLLKPQFSRGNESSWQTYHILLDESLDQADVIAKLRAFGIGSNLGAQCMPEQRFYLDKYDLDSATLFPHSLKAYKKGIAIPLYEKLDEEQITYIVNILNCIE